MSNSELEHWNGVSAISEFKDKWDEAVRKKYNEWLSKQAKEIDNLYTVIGLKDKVLLDIQRAYLTETSRQKKIRIKLEHDLTDLREKYKQRGQTMLAMGGMISRRNKTILALGSDRVVDGPYTLNGAYENLLTSENKRLRKEIAEYENSLKFEQSEKNDILIRLEETIENENQLKISVERLKAQKYYLKKKQSETLKRVDELSERIEELENALDSDVRVKEVRNFSPFTGNS